MTDVTTSVSLYTLSTCPWCRKAKAFFTEHDVPFDFVDYDLADEDEQDRIQDEMSQHNAGAFPYAKIGDTVVVGFDPQRYRDLLGLE
jgi:glutaredoxin